MNRKKSFVLTLSCLLACFVIVKPACSQTGSEAADRLDFGGGAGSRTDARVLSDVERKTPSPAVSSPHLLLAQPFDAAQQDLIKNNKFPSRGKFLAVPSLVFARGAFAAGFLVGNSNIIGNNNATGDARYFQWLLGYGRTHLTDVSGDRDKYSSQVKYQFLKDRKLLLTLVGSYARTATGKNISRYGTTLASSYDLDNTWSTGLSVGWDKKDTSTANVDVVQTSFGLTKKVSSSAYVDLSYALLTKNDPDELSLTTGVTFLNAVANFGITNRGTVFAKFNLKFP